MICAGSECKAHGQQHLRKDVRAHDGEVLLGRLGLLGEEHVAQNTVGREEERRAEKRRELAPRERRHQRQEHADAQRAEHDHVRQRQRTQGARDAPAAALIDDHDARGIGRAHEHDPEPAHVHGVGRIDVHKVAHVAEEERRRAEGEEMLLQRAQQKQVAQTAQQQAGDHPKRRRAGKGEVRQRDDRHQRDLRRLAQVVIAAPAADEVHDGERRQKHRE